MKITCRNEDGYGNVVYVDYEVEEPQEEDLTAEEIAEALEEIT